MAAWVVQAPIERCQTNVRPGIHEEVYIKQVPLPGHGTTGSLYMQFTAGCGCIISKDNIPGQVGFFHRHPRGILLYGWNQYQRVIGNADVHVGAADAGSI